MEGNKVYEDSYKEIASLYKQNAGGRVSIDYTKLDTETASVLRLAIRKALLKRKGEVWIKKELFMYMLGLKGKEIITEEEVSGIVKNNEYSHMIMDYVIEHYEKMKGFIFYPEYDVWIEEKCISKYKCENFLCFC